MSPVLVSGVTFCVTSPCHIISDGRLSPPHDTSYKSCNIPTPSARFPSVKYPHSTVQFPDLFIFIKCSFCSSISNVFHLQDNWFAITYTSSNTTRYFSCQNSRERDEWITRYHHHYHYHYHYHSLLSSPVSGGRSVPPQRTGGGWRTASRCACSR